MKNNNCFGWVLPAGTLSFMVNEYRRIKNFSESQIEQLVIENKDSKTFGILENEYKEQFSFLELVRIYDNRKVFNKKAFIDFCTKYLRLYRDPNDKNQFLQVKGCFLHIVEKVEILLVVKNYLKEFFNNSEYIVVKNMEGKTIFRKTLTEILCFVNWKYRDILRKTTLEKLPFLELDNKLHYDYSDRVVFKFFDDLVLKITAEDKQELSYSDFGKLGLYVFAHEISPFPYIKGQATHSDIDKFIKNITRDAEGNLSVKRENWAKLLLGYLCTPMSLHTIENPAVVLSDINFQGRTGKGLLTKMVMHYINPSVRKYVRNSFNDNIFVSIDCRLLGKNFRYCLDDVNFNTRILLFNDITKALGIKNYFLSMWRAKLILTTNFSVNEQDASLRGKFWELNLFAYYSHIFKPFDDFGKLFFLHWDEQDWANFEDYMHNCVSLYLAENLKKGGNISSN